MTTARFFSTAFGVRPMERVVLNLLKMQSCLSKQLTGGSPNFVSDGF